MMEDFRACLSRGEPLIGTILSLPSPELAEIAADAGFDWLFLDMEHGCLDIKDVQRMVQAVRPPCVPVVRVPSNEEVWIKKALDTGAGGLIIPHVNSGDEAAAAVRRAKYPPEGGRSVGFTRANRFGLRFQDHVGAANQTTAVIAQIEHIDGVRNIQNILDTPGIDSVFIGPYDLSASLGKPGRTQEEDVRETIEAVRRACASRQIPAGIFAPDIPSSEKAIQNGYSLICTGIDIGLYTAAAGGIIAALKRLPR